MAVVTNGRYNRRNVFRSPGGARDFFLRQSIQLTGAYPVSYFVDARHCFYWGKLSGDVSLTYRHLVWMLGMSERTKPASLCIHGVHRDTFTFYGYYTCNSD